RLPRRHSHPATCHHRKPSGLPMRWIAHSKTTTNSTSMISSPRMSANQANTSGRVTLRRDVKFNGVKVFSATMVADRDQLGEKVTAWMANNPQHKVTDLIITQSSDEAFHCIAITVFYWNDAPRR